jgi:hypothetical protein
MLRMQFEVSGITFQVEYIVRPAGRKGVSWLRLKT